LGCWRFRKADFVGSALSTSKNSKALQSVPISIRRFPRPTLLPGDLSDWLRTFAGAFTRALPHADRGAFIAEVREALRPVLCGDEERWTVDYVRLRFTARKAG
jgi:hypothetical protein